MAQWKQRLQQDLHRGHAELRIESVESGSVPLQDSRALRVTVSIFWNEGPRARSTRLVAVRM
jgi:hypothetical protein